MHNQSTKEAVLVLLFFFCTISAVFSQTYVNKEWSVNNGNPLMLQWSNSLRTTGGLITVGNTQVAGQGANILLTKYTSTGGIAWSVNYNVGGTKNDYGTNLTRDGSGNIYVCGMTDNNGLTNYDIVILKYNSSGTLLWDTTYDSPYTMNDLATGIIVDPSNNIYVAGSSEGSTTQFDFITLKYNSSGIFKWVSRYDYTNLQDYGGGITLNSTNTSLYVTGASASGVNDWDYTTVEYDLSGTQIAEVRNNVAGAGYDQPYAYAKDNSGNMYITGKGSTDGIDYDMKTIKLTPALVIDWDNSIDNAGLEDVGNAIAVDNNNDILVGGYTTTSATHKEAKLVKYDNTGSVLWTFERHSDFPTGNAEVKGIDIDGSDNVFLCIENQGNTSKDVAVIKLDRRGSPQWERRIQTNHNETPTGIKVYDDGSVYVTYVDNLGFSNSYTVVKYNDYTMDTSMFYTDNGRAGCMKHQLIVKFKNSALNKDAIDNTLGTAEIEYANIDYFLESTANDELQKVLSDLCNEMEAGTCLITTTRIYPTLKTTDTSSLTRQGTTIPFSDYWTTLLLEFPDGISLQDVKDRLDKLEIVDYCEANTFARLFSGANDSYYSWQHSLHYISGGYANSDINVEPAWDIVPSGGKKFVRVGVVDAYGSWRHEDFGYDGANPVTSKLNGWNLNVNWNLKNDTLATPTYNFTHGTLCLGTIGAIRNNGIHIAGIAGGNYTGEGGHLDDGVSLYCLEAYTGNYKLDTGNYVQLKDLANAVLISSIFDSTANYKYGLDIENLSWGIWPSKIVNLGMTVDSVSTTLSRAIHGANRNLTTLVGARGHSAGGFLDSVTTPAFPACFDDDWIINTGGTNENGNYQTSMGQGFNMDISAPSWDLLSRSIYGTSDNSYYGGTSPAAAHVSGVAALLMTYMNDTANYNYKNLSPEDVEHIIQLSATDINAAGYDSLNGFGRLNAGKALQLVQKPSNTLYHFGTNPSANCTPSINLTSLYTGDTITITEPYENEALTWFKKGKYIVNTYQLTFTATYSLSANDTIVSYWPRPSSSNTFQLFNVNKVLIPHEKLNILSCTNTQTVTRGYCYEVSDTLGNPLGWWPKNIPALIGNGALKSEFSILAHNKTSWPNGTPQVQINDSRINVYPNPSSEIQYIEISSTKVEPIIIELLDMTGRKLSLIFTGQTIVGNFKIPAYLSMYSSGMYQYRVQIGNSSKTIKINKQ
jgi:hypothetical protein